MIVANAHMRPVLTPDSLREKIRLAQAALQGYDFDTIAFRGMSGAFLGPAIATAMNKQMILVRKPNDTSASVPMDNRLMVEGNNEAKKYVIVDDVVSTGKTKIAIIEAVSKFAPDACYLGLLDVYWLNWDKLNTQIQEQGMYQLI